MKFIGEPAPLDPFDIYQPRGPIVLGLIHVLPHALLRSVDCTPRLCMDGRRPGCTVRGNAALGVGAACGNASKVSRKKRKWDRASRGTAAQTARPLLLNAGTACRPPAHLRALRCLLALPPAPDPDPAGGCPSPAHGNTPCQAAQAVRSPKSPTLPAHPQPGPHAP